MPKLSPGLKRGPSTNRSSVDKFLLAIIDAYPVGSDGETADEIAQMKERERRLLAAKKALFLERPASGQPQFDDESSLRKMAREHLRDRQKNKKDPNLKVRSVRELAKGVANKTGQQSEIATIERLRKKFSANKTHYIHADYYGDDVEGWFELQDLQNLRKHLQSIGIKMNLNAYELKIPLKPRGK
jgi:hypothetical protein